MKSLFRWILASLSAVLAIFATDQVDAQTFLGNGSAVWSDPTNWSGGVVPSGTTALTFGGAPINTTSFNDYVGLTVLGINFTNGAPALWANTTQNRTQFTLNGNKIILGGNIITSAQSHNGSPMGNRTIRDTINLNLDLNGNRTITINQLGVSTVNQTQHPLVINGNIGETGSGFALTKTGSGALTLNGTNTFTGGITITNGIINSGNLVNAFGSNNIRSSNGTVQYIGTGNHTFSTPIEMYNIVNQGVTISAEGIGNANSVLTYTGALTSNQGNQTKTLTLSGANTGVNRFASIITDGSSVPTALSKTGTGRWAVGSNNTYSGLTSLNGGTLNVSNLQDDLAFPSSIGHNATINFAGGQLRYASATVGPQVMANRSIQLPGTNNQGATILNDSLNDGPSNNTLVFNGAFTIPNGTQSKTLTLGGTNTGNNTFNSVIPNGPTAITNLTKANAGNWIVSGNNTFSGPANANGGEIRVPFISDNIATPQPLGVSGNTSFNGGTLAYVGTQPISISSNRTFTIIGSGGLRNNAAAGITVNFSGSHNYISGTAENNNTRIWTLGGTNTDANQYNTVIADAPSFLSLNGTFRKPTGVQKLNGGFWEVTGANTYTGATTIADGTLSVTSIGNTGAVGNLGTGTEVGNRTGNLVGNATIRLGLENTTGELRYTGAGESSDRLFQIGQSTNNAVSPANHDGGGRIINNGTGALNFTSAMFNESVNANSTAPRVLTLGGTFAGVNNIAGVIQDNNFLNNGTNAQVRVVKEGTTTWSLNSASTYSGNTTINAGTLLVSSGSTGYGEVIVNPAGKLGATGRVVGNTTVRGEFSSGLNGIGTVTFAQDLSLAENSKFRWELNSQTQAGRGINFDAVNVEGSLFIDPSAESFITINNFNGTDPIFWGDRRSWLVFDLVNNNYSGPLFGSISAPQGGINWGNFEWSTTPATGIGTIGDVYLNWVFPEPSSLLLSLLGLTGSVLRRTRKSCR